MLTEAFRRIQLRLSSGEFFLEDFAGEASRLICTVLSAPTGLVSAAISRAFRHFLASQSLISRKKAVASGVIVTLVFPSPLSGSAIARWISVSKSSLEKGLNSKIWERETRALLMLKNGFCVVAPLRVFAEKILNAGPNILLHPELEMTPEIPGANFLHRRIQTCRRSSHIGIKIDSPYSLDMFQIPMIPPATEMYDLVKNSILYKKI